MQSPQTSIGELKQRMRSTWMTGDFAAVAEYAGKAAEDFVARLGPLAGMKILDVACCPRARLVKTVDRPQSGHRRSAPRSKANSSKLSPRKHKSTA
jgi:hypothetical protein